MNKSYDVFISFKNKDEHGNQTEDSAIAERLYGFLAGKGLNVFYSNIELPNLGVAQYAPVIDKALESSKFLVIVGCSRENMESEWVKYEWISFLNAIRIGVKTDSEVFVFFQGMTVKDLPFALLHQQAFSADDLSSFEKLHVYIANAIGRASLGKKSPEPAQPGNCGDARETGSMIQFKDLTKVYAHIIYDMGITHMLHLKVFSIDSLRVSTQFDGFNDIKIDNCTVLVSSGIGLQGGVLARHEKNVERARDTWRYMGEIGKVENFTMKTYNRLPDMYYFIVKVDSGSILVTNVYFPADNPDASFSLATHRNPMLIDGRSSKEASDWVAFYEKHFDGWASVCP